MIVNFRKNCMGTIDFDAKFEGMRKSQEFSVYPIKKGDSAENVTIQSDTRIGQVDLSSGWVTLSKAHPSGAYFHHLATEGYRVERLSAEELLMLKAHVMGSADAMAGSNGIVFTDNSGASNVFTGGC